MFVTFVISNVIPRSLSRSTVRMHMSFLKLDANSNLGQEIIPGDPHPQSKNGKLLEKFLLYNYLVVVDGLGICKGKITRYRKTINRTEESVLDLFIVCRSFLDLIIKMTIDKERQFSLTKFGTKMVRNFQRKVIIIFLSWRLI